MPIGATIGAGIIGAGVSAYGASKAADAQTKAAQEAARVQMEMFNRTQQNLAPYMDMGQKSGNMLMGALPSLTTPFGAPAGSGATGQASPQGLNAALAATPGYQFTLDQGLKATQNSYASQGLGSSGAAMKGAGQFATGLASQTFQQQYQNYLQQQMQNYNMLLGPTQLGANAAAGLGSQATATGQGVANSLTGAGNAQAGAWMAGTGAINQGLNNASGNYMQYSLMQNMFKNQGANTYAGVTNPNAWSDYNMTGLPWNNA